MANDNKKANVKQEEEKKVVKKHTPATLCKVKNFRGVPMACMRQWFKAFKNCMATKQHFKKEKIDKNDNAVKSERIKTGKKIRA